MTGTILTISSKNYSSWSLRGWLLCRMAGLDFVEEVVPPDDPANRAGSAAFAVDPRPLPDPQGRQNLGHPGDRRVPQRSQSESGAAAGGTRRPCPLPLDLRRNSFGVYQSAIGAADELKAHRPGFKIWSGAQADIERIATIWRECFAAHHGPYLFGKLTMADAMYAPVVTRFLTYDVKLDRQSAGYCERIMALPDMVAWRSAAMLEPEELEELDMEF